MASNESFDVYKVRSNHYSIELSMIFHRLKLKIQVYLHKYSVRKQVLNFIIQSSFFNFILLLAAQGKLIVPKWIPLVAVIVIILSLVAAGLSMAYFISYPRG
jgi:hypothetical protein